MLVFFTNQSLMEFQVRYVFISSFLSNRHFQVALDGKSSQGYPVNAGVPQDSILGPTLFLVYINDLPDVMCNIAVYDDDTTLCVIRHLICGNNQRWLLNLNLIHNTLDWDRKWLVDSVLEKKLNFFYFIGLIILVLFM